MPKQKIGSIKQKLLVEGDENLLEKNEILIQKDVEFPYILKERAATGELKTFLVISVDHFIKSLEDAYNTGLSEDK